ncbi:alkaline phosphatase D family protein [Sphingomonas sp.]|uniref:alkaline phosphatase D family protein n=1 Tax=Sphingomonas sp. TaxID=28214 RepID=UPI000DB7BF9A|nr:alkaline phosphatase D family protein [Sphingomonas sp.]PZU08054.1 MAG: alkaline phosphatase [Sphingomonas sp.]
MHTPDDIAAPAGSEIAALSRRSLIVGVGASAALIAIGAKGALPLAPGLFSLGVASGYPMPGSVILWTRLAPKPLEADGGMPPADVPVRWEVAEDEGFARIARSGTARAEPGWGHSVHVEAAGLRPARVYHYRFIAGGETSPVGRTRTAPAAGVMPDRFRFAFASCQKYEAGFYAAYRHMVADDPDLVVFLGDYIYEADPNPRNAVRLHLNPEPKDIGGYRVRYATYKRDPLLQAAHQAAPWLLTWDDHEVANDYAADLDEKNGDRGAFLLRRAAAYQAYYEHQPLPLWARPKGPSMRLYTAVDWGGLAQFQIVDDRQYRGPRACQPPELLARHEQYQVLVPPCADLDDPGRTMLGSAQEQWLMRQLGTTKARWNILAQETLMRRQGRIDAAHPEKGPLLSADTWSTYPVARDRIFRRWAEARTANPFSIGGDIHAFAADSIQDPARPDAAPIGAEFVGGSITSLFNDASFKQQAPANGLVFAENEVRGYGLATLTPDGGDVAFRGLANALKEDSAIADIARFTLDPREPGIHKTLG